ncbi:MAG TPA: CBS domain-containing protein [Chitinophagaceae bacterium]|nr:CBS domain-containing protein [Chitinophagaceae bacterium]
MRTVKDMLDSKQKSFNRIESNALVIDAINLMNSVNLSYLIVLDGDEYRGIFSERDYTRNVILKGRSSSSTMVKEAMTTDLPIVALNDTVEYCMNLMNAHKTRYLLAYDGRHFAGVVTMHDLLRQVIANREDIFDRSVAKTLIDNDESGHID